MKLMMIVIARSQRASKKKWVSNKVKVKQERRDGNAEFVKDGIEEILIIAWRKSLQTYSTSRIKKEKGNYFFSKRLFPFVSLLSVIITEATKKEMRIIVPVYISREEGNIEDFFNPIHLFFSCVDDTAREWIHFQMILLIIYYGWFWYRVGKKGTALLRLVSNQNIILFQSSHKNWNKNRGGWKMTRWAKAHKKNEKLIDWKFPQKILYFYRVTRPHTNTPSFTLTNHSLPKSEKTTTKKSIFSFYIYLREKIS